MVESRDRAAMGKQIIADFERIMSHIDENNLLCQDEAKGKKVYFSQDGNLSQLQSFMDDTVLKPADYVQFCHNWFEHISQSLPGKVSYFKLEVDQGHQCVRQKVHSPLSEYIIASRQIFNTYYPDLEAETPGMFVSARGNDYLAEKYKQEVSWDVVAEYDMNGMRFAPLKND